MVLILNFSVSPGLTLMSVANPCRVSSPAPLMSQTDCGVPGLLFSQAITFTGATHGSAAEAVTVGSDRPMKTREAASTTRNASGVRLAVP